MLTMRAARGLSIVEMLIGIAIVAFLLFIGTPALTLYLQNAKLRSAAETFLSGLQLARAEAVRRNAQVEFILTSDDPVDANKNTTSLDSSALNWIVRTPDPDVPGSYLFVEGKSIYEGSGVEAGSGQGVALAGSSDKVTFNGFGATTLGATATFAFTSPAGGACAPSGPMRCLNVTVSVGGQARMCDPAVTAAGDTRKC